MIGKRAKRPIGLDEFDGGIFSIWNQRRMLLTSGEFATGKFNAMPVSSGFFGELWGVPSAIVFVRPQRRTFDFLEEYSTFTLCGFSDRKFQEIIEQLGSVSGRDVPDKITRAGLTPVAAKRVDAPIYREAELAVECTRLCRGKLDGRNFFLKSLIEEHYPDRDYHSFYIGHIEAVTGTGKYVKE